MIAIVCIKVGDKYDSEYVNRLYNMVKNHLICEYKFICYTDNPQGVDKSIVVKQPPCEYPGWWSKLGLLKDDLDTDGIEDVLYLDLDLVIISSLNNILKKYKEQGGFWIAKDAWHQTYNSSVMLFKKGILHNLFDNFDMSYARENGGSYRSDQDWISDKYDKANILISVISYKAHVRYSNKVPGNVDIIMFHGTPNPDGEECRNLFWIKKHYFGLSSLLDKKKLKIGFAIGNGQSRQGYDLTKLEPKGFLVGCNALYRDYSPNLLVATDPLLIKEIRDNYTGLVALRGGGRYIEVSNHLGDRFKFEDLGMASGPTSIYLAISMGLNRIYLLGHDINITNLNNEMNNIYKGTPGYVADGEVVYGNFIRHIKMILLKYPNVDFVFVNNQQKVLKDFDKCNNVKYINYKEFEKELLIN